MAEKQFFTVHLTPECAKVLGFQTKIESSADEKPEITEGGLLKIRADDFVGAMSGEIILSPASWLAVTVFTVGE